MIREKNVKLTRFELEVMTALWELGAASVREIQEKLPEKKRPAYTTVQVACKVSGFRVADGNTWWYRIASAPWSNNYYVSADAFYNNGQTSGSLVGTPFVDSNVPNC